MCSEFISVKFECYAIRLFWYIFSPSNATIQLFLFNQTRHYFFNFLASLDAEMVVIIEYSVEVNIRFFAPSYNIRGSSVTKVHIKLHDGLAIIITLREHFTDFLECH